MHRRAALAALPTLLALALAHPHTPAITPAISTAIGTPAAAAQGTPRREPSRLAAYYERHGLLRGDTAWGWDDRGTPQPLRGALVQLAVSRHAWYGLNTRGELLLWTQPEPAPAQRLRERVARFAADANGWIAIDRDGAAWQAGDDDVARRVMAGAKDGAHGGVIDACVGDSADDLVTADGRLHVHGLAHRGQYGDGLLKAQAAYVATATDVVAVRAHTGHALALRRDGGVLGTGGNRFGPLASHGLGDKADRWGLIFDGAVAIATGSRHSLALRADGTLWQWDGGRGPRRLGLGRR